VLAAGARPGANRRARLCSSGRESIPALDVKSCVGYVPLSRNRGATDARRPPHPRPSSTTRPLIGCSGLAVFSRVADHGPGQRTRLFRINV